MSIFDPQDLQQVAASNPKVDVQAVERVREFTEQLERAGAVRKSEYKIDPPLGRRSESILLLALKR